jgi:general secretion pathway protein G
MLKKEKGFTLVELMIVIIILAVLTGIAIPSYLAVRKRTREIATEASMSNIALALSIYEADNELFPLVAQYPDDLETRGYMKYVPDNDSWDNAFQYASVNGSSYTLESYGIDGVDGGGDDIVFMDGLMVEDGAYTD